MSAAIFADSLEEISAQYQGFIIDQWGVLHDGGQPYPDAVECLTMLRQSGKRIVLLSNSGKRAAHNGRRLQQMGYDPHLFDAIVTSGEACWQALHDRSDPELAGLGKRCYLWSRGDDLSHVDGLAVDLVDDADDADFLYLAGVMDYAELDTFVPSLRKAARRDLPMICANPDIIAIYPDGGRGMAPGAVAQHYRQLGGKVVFVGKPHRPVYDLCLAKLGAIARDDILGIGDSMEHDIAGGNGIEIDTMLLTHGVHRDSFAGQDNEWDKQQALQRLEAEFKARPRWVLPRFVW